MAFHTTHLPSEKGEVNYTHAVIAEGVYDSGAITSFKYHVRETDEAGNVVRRKQEIKDVPVRRIAVEVLCQPGKWHVDQGRINTNGPLPSCPDCVAWMFELVTATSETDEHSELTGKPSGRTVLASVPIPPHYDIDPTQRHRNPISTCAETPHDPSLLSDFLWYAPEPEPELTRWQRLLQSLPARWRKG